MLAKKFVLNTPYQGEARLDNFKLVEEVLPELKDGGKNHAMERHLFTYIHNRNKSKPFE